MKNEIIKELDSMNYTELESILYSLGLEFSKRAINTPFKGKNFMTDEIVFRGKIKGNFFELSYGRGFDNNWLIGVTFCDSFGKFSDQNECCHSIVEARAVLEGFEA